MSDVQDEMSTAERLRNLVKEGFTDGGNYDRYRPDYEPETIDVIVSMLFEKHPAPSGGECDILELGAGTGKLTQYLPERLPKDRKFIASEPMQNFLTTLKSRCPKVDSRQFFAESMPLPDNSVQGIVAAQSFHWFANQPATDEITRVLKPGGNLVLLWKIRDTRVGWINAIVTRINEHVTSDEPRYSSLEWKKFMDGYKGLTLKCRKYLDCLSVEHTKEDIVNNFTTSSVITRMSVEIRQKVLKDIRHILDTDPETNDKERIPFPMFTDICHYVKL